MPSGNDDEAGELAIYRTGGGGNSPRVVRDLQW